MESGKTRQEIGKYAERLAEKHLSQHGLRLLQRNYRCRGGEIDLIMTDARTLVFVEVRYRSHPGYGGAAASVDWHKKQRILCAAQHYLQHSGKMNRPCRLDVVAITPGGNGTDAVEWISNAIELS